MYLNKKYVGEVNNVASNKVIEYYVVKNSKTGNYGVELVEKQHEYLESTTEWFTDDFESAVSFVTVLYKNEVSPVHLTEVLDDYIA